MYKLPYFQQPYRVFCHFENNNFKVFLYYIQGSGIALYVSYIQSRTMHVVPMEKA